MGQRAEIGVDIISNVHMDLTFQHFDTRRRLGRPSKWRIDDLDYTGGTRSGRGQLKTGWRSHADTFAQPRLHQ